MKVLITPAPDKAICFWCRGRKKECVTADFSSGFLKGKPLCFECLERATRVQFGSDENSTGQKSDSTTVVAKG